MSKGTGLSIVKIVLACTNWWACGGFVNTGSAGAVLQQRRHQSFRRWVGVAKANARKPVCRWDTTGLLPFISLNRRSCGTPLSSGRLSLGIGSRLSPKKPVRRLEQSDGRATPVAHSLCPAPCKAPNLQEPQKPQVSELVEGKPWFHPQTYRFPVDFP